MTKELKKFKTWSTFFYLLPLALAIHFQVWLTVIPLSLLILVCFEYHFSREKKFGQLDHILAWSVICSNLVLCLLGGFAMPFFGIALLCAVLSIVIYNSFTSKRHYNEMHGVWHIVSAFITVFSVLTFTGGF